MIVRCDACKWRESQRWSNSYDAKISPAFVRMLMLPVERRFDTLRASTDVMRTSSWWCCRIMNDGIAAVGNW